LLFSDLRTELVSRGTDYLDATGTVRQDMYLNMGYTRLNEAYDWPWLYADASGTAPLIIADLRTVLSVVDQTNNVKLVRFDRREIVELDPGLLATANPYYYYRDSDTQIKVYPVNTTATIAVRYLKVPPALVNAGDTPIIPLRWHPLIVDGAMVEVAKDADDAPGVEAFEKIFEQRLMQMKAAYIDESGPSYIDPVVSGWSTTF
jgi:hypothetical protein